MQADASSACKHAVNFSELPDSQLPNISTVITEIANVIYIEQMQAVLGEHAVNTAELPDSQLLNISTASINSIPEIANAIYIES